LETVQADASIATSFEQQSDMSFSAGSLFHAMFAENASPLMQGIDSGAVLFLTEALVATGAVLQRSTSSDHIGFDESIADFQYILRLAVSYVRKTAGGRR
jgi:hypothetical protein